MDASPLEGSHSAPHANLYKKTLPSGTSVALLVLSLTQGHKLLNLCLEELLMQEPVYIIELCKAPCLLQPTFPADSAKNDEDDSSKP